MAISSAGLALIKHFEGLYLKAYVDPVGILTIGYGHTGADVTPGLTITEAQAEALLADDIATHEDFVDDVVTIPINADQRAALVSFAFNVGNGNLKGSTLLKKLNQGDFPGAADEFLRWVYGTVNGVKKQLKGLVRRREAERALFLGQALSLPSPKMLISAAPSSANPAPPLAAAPALGSAAMAGSSPGMDADADFVAHIQGLNLKYFKPYEFLVMGHQHDNPNSPAHGKNTKPPRQLWNNINETAKVLDHLRELMGAPITTLSVYRSPAYNAAIGGAGASHHMNFNAIDFVVKSNSSPSDWAAVLRSMRQSGHFKGGIGTYKTFVHLDTRGTNADW